MTILVEVFRDIVEKLNLATDRNVNYLHGHPIEVLNTIDQLTKLEASDDLKFPLIALFQDFEETINENSAIENEVSLTIMILSLTKQEYTASERYENTFKTELYPIYIELINQIKKHVAFQIDFGNVLHTKIDRLYWGKQALNGNDANKGGDFIDAIEIKNLRIKILKQSCKTNKSWVI